MEPSEDEITTLQKKAVAKIESDGTGKFHPKDVERLKTDRDWIRRFLLHQELDQDKSLAMIVDALAWRKSFGTNEITESNVKKEILTRGAIFAHNKDKDGKLMFIIKAKLSPKGTDKLEDQQRALVYWFERLERLNKGDKITVFFEMTDAGLSCMDMDCVQYLITLFRDYYPWFLNYILVFEMNWILNAAWNIIKGWMPAKSVELVKFVKRSNLKEYVNPDQQLVEWGGSDNYTFTFEPEVLSPTNASRKDIPNSFVDDSRKKVHFAEDTASTDSGATEASEERKLSPGQLLQLTPSEEIVFKREDGETTGSLAIHNVTETPVAYKIKTTSPDKYRVRPSVGVLAPSASLSINVHIQPGYGAASLVRDKFLVMACAVDATSMTNSQLAEFWKNNGGDGQHQSYRLRCTVAPSDASHEEFNPAVTGASAKQLNELMNRVDLLVNGQSQMQSQITKLRRMVWFLCIVNLGILVVLYRWHCGSDGEDDAIAEASKSEL